MTRGDLKARIAAAIDAQQGEPDAHAIAAEVFEGLTPEEAMDALRFLLPEEVRAIANAIRKEDVRRVRSTATLRRGHTRGSTGQIPVPRDIQRRSIERALRTWAPYLPKTRLAEVDHEGALTIAQSFEDQGEVLLDLADRWRQVAARLAPGQRLSQLPIPELVEVFALIGRNEEEVDAEAV